jgi:PPE-repeat protein
MDFGALPPEINSARMYSGPGSESMLTAATAWDGLAAELQSTASSYGSVISGLTDESWVGPSSTAMEAAATPYVAWLNSAAGQAEQTASQARAAAAAYQAAFAMTVPPATILANRTQLASLTATNVFGQNTPAIAANEAQYGEMWAQDATAMYGYAGNSAAASTLTTFTTPPSITNPAGAASQAAAVTQAAGTSTGAGVQSTLSQITSAVPTTLQSLASPAASSSSTSGLSDIESALGLTSSSTTGPLANLSNLLSDELPGFSLGGTVTGLLTDYGYLPGFMGIFLANDAIAPAFGTAVTQAMAAPLAGGAAAAPLVGGAAVGAAAAGGALGPGLAGGLGGLAGLGQAASVGALSVPQSWGWAATPQAAMLGGMPLAAPLPGVNLMGATSGLPMAAGLPLMMGGVPRAAGVAAAAGVGGAVASKYGRPRTVVARPPAAGYSPAPASLPATPYPVPAGFSTNGHAPPGYTPAIVYLPTNGHAPHDT